MKLLGSRSPIKFETPTGSEYKFDVGVVAGKQQIVFEMVAQQDMYIPRGATLHLVVDVDFDGKGAIVK